MDIKICNILSYEYTKVYYQFLLFSILKQKAWGKVRSHLMIMTTLREGKTPLAKKAAKPYEGLYGESLREGVWNFQ